MTDADEPTPLRLQELIASKAIKGKIDSRRMNAPRFSPKKIGSLQPSSLVEMVLKGRRWTKGDTILRQKLAHNHCRFEDDFFE
jgi:hypothetical protein